MICYRETSLVAKSRDFLVRFKYFPSLYYYSEFHFMSSAHSIWIGNELMKPLAANDKPVGTYNNVNLV